MIAILIVLAINMAYGLHRWFGQDIEDDGAEC
jgi:hypothetical protein